MFSSATSPSPHWVAPLAGAWIEIIAFATDAETVMSLPSRERGLKFFLTIKRYTSIIVAPLAGAWIEIALPRAVCPHTPVAPLAGAWIEISIFLHPPQSNAVAPLAGAWIEIRNVFCWLYFQRVAPLAGAWIEIREEYVLIFVAVESLPSRERGLKYI